MKTRPILFSGPMVRALLAGNKTQTRRVVKHKSDADCPYHENNIAVACPYGKVGDRLWVRETWRVDWADEAMAEIGFRADEDSKKCAPPFPWLDRANEKHLEPDSKIRWQPSIFMPRWACRVILEITAVRVERLQDISEEDAKAEGVDTSVTHPSPTGVGKFRVKNYVFAREAYADLWRLINGHDSWAQNPWVWVIEFKRL